MPASRDVSHILVKSHERATALRAQIVREGPRHVFAMLARRFSQDPSPADAGGRLTVGQGQTVPEFDKVAFRPRTGAVSQPVHTQFGWHIIWTPHRIHPGHRLPLRAVAAEIVQTQSNELKTRAIVAFIANAKRVAVLACLDPYRVTFARAPSTCRVR